MTTTNTDLEAGIDLAINLQDIERRKPSEYLLARTVLELQKQLARAAYLTKNLVEQVPEFTGVVGPGGESEDEFIRHEIREEVHNWEAIAPYQR